MGTFNVWFREISNGTWAHLNLFMLMTLLGFLYCYTRDHGLSFREWRNDKVVVMVVAWLIYLVGTTLARISTWLMFVGGDDNLGARQLANNGIEIGAAIGVVGGLCCIRVFAPTTWGNKAWIASGVTAIIVPVLVYWLY